MPHPGMGSTEVRVMLKKYNSKNESIFQKTDQTRDSSHHGKSTKSPNQSPTKGEISKIVTRKMRKEILHPLDTKHPEATMLPHIRRSSRDLRFSIFSIAENLFSSNSGIEIRNMSTMNLSTRRNTINMFVDIHRNMDKHVYSDDNRKSMAIHALTEMEMLQCSWLRLTKEQIGTLEELIRQQGKDPGLHAHSDITDYDIFSEIREIRHTRAVLTEEEEEH